MRPAQRLGLLGTKTQEDQRRKLSGPVSASHGLASSCNFYPGYDIHLESPPGLSFPSGIHIWDMVVGTHLGYPAVAWESTRGIGVERHIYLGYHFYLGYLSGISMWDIHVGYLCGIAMWDTHAEHSTPILSSLWDIRVKYGRRFGLPKKSSTVRYSPNVKNTAKALYHMEVPRQRWYPRRI